MQEIIPKKSLKIILAEINILVIHIKYKWLKKKQEIFAKMSKKKI